MESESIRKNEESLARKRYDAKHPIVSFRVSAESYDRLKTLLRRQNKSIGDFFREALEIEERNYSEARRRGYRKGFGDAKEKYAVFLTCVACYDGIPIDDENVKEELVESYERNVLHHECQLPHDLSPEMVVRVGHKKK